MDMEKSPTKTKIQPFTAASEKKDKGDIEANKGDAILEVIEEVTTRLEGHQKARRLEGQKELHSLLLLYLVVYNTNKVI